MGAPIQTAPDPAPVDPARRAPGFGDPSGSAVGPVARERTAVARALWLFAPGVVAAAVTRLALSWDGAYFLVDLLDQGHPVVLHRRPTMVLLQVPAWLGSYVTDSTRVLGFLFTLPYVVMPVLALWLSWRVVRHRRPALMVWPALGIGFVTLPGQAFFVSESLIVAQFVWPLVLALLVGHRWRWWSSGLLLLLLGCLHPMAAMVFGTAALVALAVGWQRPADRPWAWRQAGVLLGAALVRQVLTSLRVDSDVPKQIDIVNQWRHAVNGVPLTAVLLVSVAGALLVACWWPVRGDGGAGSEVRSGWHAPVVGWVATGLLVVAGALLAGWGFRLRAWAVALDYRSFVLLFAVPVVACAAVDALQGSGKAGRSAPDAAARRGPPTVTAAAVVGLSALVFSTVLVGQGIGWQRLTDRVDRAVHRSPRACVVESHLPERHTALNHWATPALALLGQGRRPHRVVVADLSACRRLVVTGALDVPRTAKLRKPVRHWFHLGRARAASRIQMAPEPVRRTTGPF